MLENNISNTLILISVINFLMVIIIKMVKNIGKYQIPGVIKLLMLLSLIPINIVLIKNIEMPLVYAIDIFMIFFSLCLIKSAIYPDIVYLIFRLSSLAILNFYYILFEDYNYNLDPNFIYENVKLFHFINLIFVAIALYLFIPVFLGKVIFNDKHKEVKYGYLLTELQRRRGLTRVQYDHNKVTTSTVEAGIETIFRPLIILQNKIMKYYFKPAYYYWNNNLENDIRKEDS